MQIFANTDIGQKRKNNQDYFSKALADDGKFAWAVVCDGMGGMAAGNVASEMAAKSIANSLEINFNFNASVSSVCNLLKLSVEAANLLVYDFASNNSELKGMGTTAVAAVAFKDKVCFANVGDSRAYIYDNETLKQITTDHSVVQNMVSSGQLTVDEAKNHPNKNIITRAVGVSEHIDVDISNISFKENDILLLCTDGLTNCVDNELIENAIKNTEFEQLADKLVDLANENGGNDNITVVVIKNI